MLIEILTAANMAGVTEAKAGMLGLTPATWALGAALGGLVMAGKSAMEIAKSQTEAENGLTNAMKDRNAMIGTVIPISTSAHDKIAKAIKAHQDALANLARLEQGTYVPATQLTTLQLMKLQDAEARVANTTGTAHVNALRRLVELQVADAAHVHNATTRYGNLSAAQQRVADTAANLAKLQATVGQSIKMTGINARDVRDELYTFMQANREYITNQEDVVHSTTTLIREGVSLKNLMRDQTLILDLAAAKHIAVADATNLVAKAEAGQFKGLKDILGIATPVISASDSLAERQKKISHALDLASARTKDARKNIDELAGATNALGNDWHDFAVGPGKELTRALANGAQILDLMWQALNKIAHDDALWATISKRFADMAGGLRAIALQLGIASPTAAEDPKNQVMGGKVMSGQGAMTAAQLQEYFKKNLTAAEYAKWQKVQADKADANAKILRDLGVQWQQGINNLIANNNDRARERSVVNVTVNVPPSQSGKLTQHFTSV